MIKSALSIVFIAIRWLVIWMAINAIGIHNYADRYYDTKSDVAIVLGAGTNKGKISPVFRERINHGIALYKAGIVEHIIFTGGFGKGQTISDSQSAKNYAILKGVPADKIFIEEKSTITFTNLTNAKLIMANYHFNNALIVSDPYHMKRSLAMTKKLDIHAQPSPTPTSMYRSFKTKSAYLIYESFFYCMGVLQGYL